MIKRIIIGLLLISVLGAGGAALAYNANQQDSEPVQTTPEPLAQSQENDDQKQDLQVDPPQNKEPLPSFQEEAAQPWQREGTITGMDDYGFDLQVVDEGNFYIELGPPDYWQSQGVTLSIGERVSVTGSIQEAMIHAAQVQTADGQILILRSESGQPLWSGGATNGNGQNAASSDGDHIPEPMADVDSWVTIEGTLMSFQGGNMTMSTTDGKIITFQTGQPRFFADQGITFLVGDEIIVLGFYENDQFMAGEITQVSTGLRVMLRDPNGRPLWAGPGNGNSGGDGVQGSGSGAGVQGAGNRGKGHGAQGNSSGAGVQGAGNSNRGSAGQGSS